MSQFRYLDISVFENNFAGMDPKTSAELYVKIAYIFLKGIDGKINLIRERLLQNETNEPRVTAHQIKGTLLTLGDTQVAQIFRTIEMEIDQKSPAEHLKFLDANSVMIEEFKDELKQRITQLDIY